MVQCVAVCLSVLQCVALTSLESLHDYPYIPAVKANLVDRHTATYCNTLQHTATHCNILQHLATPCNTQQHPATHYNKLQHTATHCKGANQKSSSPHTATHCNSLQHTASKSGASVAIPRDASNSQLQCVAGCCWVLQGVAGCCRVLLGVAGCCWVLQ